MASITLNRAKQNMRDANVPMAVLAQVAGLRPTSLSSVFRGVMTLDSRVEARLLTVSCRILEISQALTPLQMPDDAGDVSRLVAQLEDGQISLQDIRDSLARMVRA